MIQWVRSLVDEPGDLSFIFGTHVGGENDSRMLSSDLHR